MTTESEDSKQVQTDLDVPFKSVAIERLIEEVRKEQQSTGGVVRAYNRTYSRHNRS